MNVEQVEVQAGMLPPDKQYALAEWLEHTKEVRELRRAALARDIQIGLEELDRGDSVQCDNEAELSAIFDGIRVRGRELLSMRQSNPLR